jgi:hypothetical protein
MVVQWHDICTQYVSGLRLSYDRCSAAPGYNTEQCTMIGRYAAELAIIPMGSFNLGTFARDYLGWMGRADRAQQQGTGSLRQLYRPVAGIRQAPRRIRAQCALAELDKRTNMKSEIRKYGEAMRVPSRRSRTPAITQLPSDLDCSIPCFEPCFHLLIARFMARQPPQEGGSGGPSSRFFQTGKQRRMKRNERLARKFIAGPIP